MGYVNNAFGFDCIVLPQIADFSTNFGLLLDDTRLYFISPSSQKIVKLILEGNTLSYTSDVYANANLTQESTLIKSFGSAVVTNAIAGTIELS